MEFKSYFYLMRSICRIILNFYFSCQLNMNTPYDSFNCQNCLQEASNQLTIGQYIYWTDKVLGSGSFGSVYRGQNNVTNELVAIKVIQLKRVNSTIQKLLLENEKAVIKLLINKEIEEVIKFMEVIETPTKVYIVMELCEGGDLQSVIKKQKLNIKSVKKYVYTLINGLIKLKQLNIVHRDFKPSNILLDAHGKLKIADFGFAVIQTEEVKAYNYCIGSPAYCSPESLSKCEYSQKSDIWALGVITYKMLSNKTPWKGKNNKELSQNMRTIPIQKLVDICKDEMLEKTIVSFCNYSYSKRGGLSELMQFRKILFEQISSMSSKSSFEQSARKLITLGNKKRGNEEIEDEEYTSQVPVIEKVTGFNLVKMV